MGCLRHQIVDNNHLFAIWALCFFHRGISIHTRWNVEAHLAYTSCVSLESLETGRQNGCKRATKQAMGLHVHTYHVQWDLHDMSAL